jgi:hypothetical protein
MKIDIESKFNIDQKVYCIEDYSEYAKCETCNGEKEIKTTINNNERTIKCPDCNGTGEGEYQLELWRLKGGSNPWVIGALYMNMWKYNNCIPNFSYEVTYSHEGGGNTSTFIDEKNCFSTTLEALCEIEKRNAMHKYVDDSE